MELLTGCASRRSEREAAHSVLQAHRYKVDDDKWREPPLRSQLQGYFMEQKLVRRPDFPEPPS
eukprot:6910484-Karenia_brevis.AAC.1